LHTGTRKGYIKINREGLIILRINFNVLDKQFFRYQQQYEQKALDVLRSGWYILGKEVAAFEEEFAAYVKSKHCVGLANGLDALWLSFRILGIGPGDEVIVPANTYIASIMGVTINGITPVLVEPDEYYNIDVDKVVEKITPKTKAVLSVNLYGQSCRMDILREICSQNHLYLVEDCAQSHGSTFNGLPTSSYADISCFSFYPSKNLGCFGDGGAITTNNEEIARLFKVYRNYGSEKRYYNMVVGTNSRLDEMQAGLLRVKLTHLDELNAERLNLANRYLTGIHNPNIRLPKVAEGASSAWHLFVVALDKRDEFAAYLSDKEIGTIVHYPIPPHLSEAYRSWGYYTGDFPITENYANTIISLPLYNGMTDEEQSYVIEKINAYER